MNKLLIVGDDDHLRRALNGDIVLAQLDNDFSIKRIDFEGSKVFLRSDNPFYVDIEVNKNNEAQRVEFAESLQAL